MSKGKFSTTPQERYLADFVEGAVHEFGPVTITMVGGEVKESRS